MGDCAGSKHEPCVIEAPVQNLKISPHQIFNGLFEHLYHLSKVFYVLYYVLSFLSCFVLNLDDKNICNSPLL